MNAELRHVGIVVQNLETCERFWIEGLGCVVASRADEDPTFISALLNVEAPRLTTVKMLLPGGGMIELLRFSSHPDASSWPGTVTQTGPTHIAVTTSNLTESLHALVGAGAQITGPPRRSHDGRARVAFCEGPEGLILEIVEPLT